MDNLLPKIIDSAQPVLLLALTWLAAIVANWIRAKVKNERLRGMMLRLDDAIVTAVKELQQTTVADVKAAAEDGKIDASEAKEIRDKAVARVKAYLGDKGISELKRIVDADALEAMIEAKLEAAVLELKNGNGATELRTIE